MKYIDKIDNVCLGKAIEMANQLPLVCEYFKVSFLSDQKEINEFIERKLIDYDNLLDKTSKLIDDYSKDYDELLVMCNGDDTVSTFYKQIGIYIVNEEYESADLTKDSLLWYFNDQYKKLNNLK